MVTIKSKREIEYMREACKVVAKMYEKLEKEIRPGMTTWELEEYHHIQHQHVYL